MAARGQLDPGYYRNPKIRQLSPEAVTLDIAGICHSNLLRTDGCIPVEEISVLHRGVRRPSKAVEELVTVGRWHEHGHDCDRCVQPTPDAFVIHDFGDFNRTASRRRVAAVSRATQRRQARDTQATDTRQNDDTTTTERRHEGDTTTTPPSSPPLPPTPPNPTPPTPASLAGSPRAQGNRLPDDWTPTPEPALQAEAVAAGVDPRRELDRFRDYWQAQSGAKGRKADWQATWRNWLRKAADDRRVPALRRSTLPSESFAEVADDDLTPFARSAP